MTRSFAYAADAALLLRRGRAAHRLAGGVPRRRSSTATSPSRTSGSCPPSRSGFDRLLALFELEKLVYELRYEARNRPDWVSIPVVGLLRMLEAPA